VICKLTGRLQFVGWQIRRLVPWLVRWAVSCTGGCLVRRLVAGLFVARGRPCEFRSIPGARCGRRHGAGLEAGPTQHPIVVVRMLVWRAPRAVPRPTLARLLAEVSCEESLFVGRSFGRAKPQCIGRGQRGGRSLGCRRRAKLLAGERQDGVHVSAIDDVCKLAGWLQRCRGRD